MAATASADEGRNVGTSGGFSQNRSQKGSQGMLSSSAKIAQQNVVIDIESEDLTYN